MPAAPSRIAILAKAPIPGYAKTRLVPRLGPEGAAALQALLLERTLRTAGAAGFPEVSLWCAPTCGEPAFDRCRIPASVPRRDQPSGDLGKRMCFAFETLLTRTTPVLLVGTDCPSLTPAHLREASAALHAGADGVLLPTLDGGYALIGLRRVEQRLFRDMPWGTSRVLPETRARACQLGWALEELPVARDIDLPADLDWLLASGLLSGEDRACLQRHLERRP